MKQYICLFVIAFLHQATCFPVSEPLPSIVPEVPSLTPEIKGAASEQKSDLPVPSVASVISEKPKIPENLTLQNDAPSDVSPLSVSAVTVAAPTPTEKTIAQDAPKELPAVAEEVIKRVEESVGNPGIIKSVTEAKKDMQTSAENNPTERYEKNFEQQQVAISSEAPKEANSQVNSVSVDEPKPVNSVVKLNVSAQDTSKQLPAVTEEVIKHVEESVGNAGILMSITAVKINSSKDKVESENGTEEVNSKKFQEVKSNLEVPQSEVIPSDKPKHEEKPVSSEESSKSSNGSSEEKIISGERGIISEEVRKESEEKTVTTPGRRESEENKTNIAANLKPTEKTPEEPKKEQEKTEEKKEEKPEEKKDEKKDLREESPVKPIAEQVIESAKQSTVAVSPVSPAIVSTATEKIVKRAAYDTPDLDCTDPLVGCFRRRIRTRTSTIMPEPEPKVPTDPSRRYQHGRVTYIPTFGYQHGRYTKREAAIDKSENNKKEEIEPSVPEKIVKRAAYDTPDLDCTDPLVGCFRRRKMSTFKPQPQPEAPTDPPRRYQHGRYTYIPEIGYLHGRYPA